MGQVHKASKIFAASRKQDGKEQIVKWAKKADEGQVFAARATELGNLASDSLPKPETILEHQEGVYMIIGHSIQDLVCVGSIFVGSD